MKDATKDALEQAGFAYDPHSDIYRRDSPGKNHEAVRSSAPERVVVYMAEHRVPAILHALTTPAPHPTHDLTDEQVGKFFNAVVDALSDVEGLSNITNWNRDDIEHIATSVIHRL